MRKAKSFVRGAYVFLTSVGLGCIDAVAQVKTYEPRYPPKPNALERALSDPQTLGIWVLVGVGLLLVFARKSGDKK